MMTWVSPRTYPARPVNVDLPSLPLPPADVSEEDPAVPVLFLQPPAHDAKRSEWG